MKNKTPMIVLCFPNIDLSKDFHHFPLSSLSLAAPLERMGIDFEIWDERVDAPERLDELLKIATIFGVTMFTGYQTHCGYALLKKAKAANADIITVTGGPHVTALPEQVAADPLVDYAIAGFGEAPFYELVGQLNAYGHLNGAEIPGVYHKGSSGDDVFMAPVTSRFDNNFWAPLPYDKIATMKYINEKTKRVMYVAHYGCPARCTFCATPHYRKWTPKPIEIVRQDIELLHNTFAFKEMCFFDATLFTRKDRVHDVVHCLDDYEGVHWLADARAVELNKYTTEELVEIRDFNAELDFLIVGLESGSKRIAEDVMKKGKKHLEMFSTVAKRMHDAEIDMISGLIFGIPGDRADDVRRTTDYVSHIREIHPAFRLSSTFFRPLPGTELYGLLDEQGWIAPKSLADWARYGERSHFRYNEWMDIPWLEGKEKSEYRIAYEEFRKQHGNILM